MAASGSSAAEEGRAGRFRRRGTDVTVPEPTRTSSSRPRSTLKAGELGYCFSWSGQAMRDQLYKRRANRASHRGLKPARQQSGGAVPATARDKRPRAKPRR